LFGTVDDLVQATQALQAAGNTRQFEALLCNPRVSGYVLTQLNDVAGEFHAGLLDHWRRPKQAYHAAREVQQPQRLVLKAARPMAACGESVAVSLTLLARQALPDGGQMHVGISGPAERQAKSLR